MTTHPGVRRPETPSRAMAAWLRGATVAVLVLGLVGLVPGAVGRGSAALAVGTAVGAPLVRVGWLALRWRRAGDDRFAVLAAGLLALVLSGAALAAVVG